MIVVLCGGVGGSRFVRAISLAVGQQRVTAIVNTADDEEIHGLHISPDPDIVTYTLAGEVDDERGWGFRDETFRWNTHMARFGRETWFNIGDRDLATHLHRTRLLREGATLSDVAADIAHAFGVGVRVLPMTNDRVRTVVATATGEEVPFQRFLIERHASDPVRDVRFQGAESAAPAPGVLEAIAEAEAIFIAPSNPIGSIRPILAIPGITAALEAVTVAKVAVSPIVGGRSLQPPAGEMMEGLGHDVSVVGVARLYAGVADTLIIDEVDATRRGDVEAAGVRCVVANTIMRDADASRALGMTALATANVQA